MPRPDRLDVYFGSELVGSLHDTAPLAFTYSTAWLQRAEPAPMASIALQSGRNDGAAVQAFFENLLPEGDLRHQLAARHKASTLFSLLLETAGDTAGGFVIVPEGETPGPATYEATSWEALAAMLRKPAASAADIHGRHARISLAGAQDKAALAIFSDGVPRLPQGTAPSTHILKPNIQRLNKVWHSAANEAITMRAAAHCGLPTAEVFYESNTQSCVVRRFDRVLRPDGSLGRLIQYDLCQLAATVSDKKYEHEGGPGIAACAELIRKHSTQPALDLRHFMLWIFFNLFAGNNDSHAKNLSLYRTPDGGGVTLTPFYDLMCTRLYPGLSPTFAFAIGGQTKPGSVTRTHVAAMATQLGMRPAYVLGLAMEMAGKLPAAVERAVVDLMPDLPEAARVLADRLERFVWATAKRGVERLA